MLPLFVVVCARNAEADIARCLRSLSKQTYPHWTCHLIDDASTDGTWQHMSAIAATDTRFHALRNDTRRYALFNQVRAIRAAPVDSVVIIVDGDDYLAHSEVFSQIAALYESDAAIDATHWGFQLVNYKGRALERVNRFRPKDPRNPYEWIEAHLRSFRANLMNQIPDSYFRAFNGLYPSHSSDSILHYRICQLAKKIHQFSEPLYCWNHGPDSSRDWNYEDQRLIATLPVKEFYRRYCRSLGSNSEKQTKLDGARTMVKIDQLSDLEITSGQPLQNVDFAFVVVFRNQAKFIQKCLRSILAQPRTYRFGIVVLDDVSNDDSMPLALDVLRCDTVPYVYVRNSDRKYRMRNIFNAVHHLITDKETIVLELDGDDWLPEKDVLGIIKRAYDKGVLSTYGTFELFPHDGDTGIHHLMKSRGLGKNFRLPWDDTQFTTWSHLKTYRKLLFEQVELKYFLERSGDRWVEQGDDICLHGKLAEIAAGRTAFIEEITYVYNLSGTHHYAHQSHRDRRKYTFERVYQTPDGRDKLEYLKELSETKPALAFLKWGKMLVRMGKNRVRYKIARTLDIVLRRAPN
jgi:glycosyltransferase involved in cell wall biosynthesis